MKRMIASITLLTISVAVLIVLGTARKATAERQSGCSNATLRGSYGIHATGAALSGPLAGPVAFVGVFTFDGRGSTCWESDAKSERREWPHNVIQSALYGNLHSERGLHGGRHLVQSLEGDVEHT